MSPPRMPRSKLPPLVARKEIPPMPLIRFLDATASVAIVFLAFYVGAATFGLGV
jgi:hypothetical protein